MNNDMEKNILEKFKLNIAISNFEKEELTNNSTLKNKKLFNIKNKIIATVCASFILISGIVFATTNIVNKRKSDRGLGDGIDTAVDNGYIATPNKGYIESEVTITNETKKIGNGKVDLKIDNFVMDDTHLSVNVIIKFDENITNIINIDKVYEIELREFIVKDEENRIVYTNEYGVQAFIESKTDKLIYLTYNMYGNDFPKSKKLYFSLGQIKLRANSIVEPTIYEINGKWNFKLDVPEEMYTRSEEYYKVIKCENRDFDVYTAKVTNTGFELGVMISNVKVPEVENLQDIDSYEIKRAISSRYSYITNEQGEKFEVAFSPGRKVKGEFLEESKFDFYETFSMTKYNATNKIKAVLYYYGEPITIELEKIK